MTYDRLLDLLLSSTKEDWLIDDSKGIFTLKSDLDVTIREVRPEDPLAPRDHFAEPWAENFPDSLAERQFVELWFRASFVKSYLFVVVDGGRAVLPIPKSATDLTITREQLAVANVVNAVESSYYDEYIGRFKVAD
jgi:hypothetical protein